MLSSYSPPYEAISYTFKGNCNVNMCRIVIFCYNIYQPAVPVINYACHYVSHKTCHMGEQS